MFPPSQKVGLNLLRSTGTESVYFTYPYQGTERNKYIGRVNFENLKVRVRNFFELMVRVRVRERADFQKTGTESRRVKIKGTPYYGYGKRTE